MIPDGGEEGTANFRAVRKDSARESSKMEATTVRVPSGGKVSKVIRFIQDLPTALSMKLSVSIVTPNSSNVRLHLLKFPL